jgi:hypothetical protein
MIVMINSEPNQVFNWMPTKLLSFRKIIDILWNGDSAGNLAKI